MDMTGCEIQEMAWFAFDDWLRSQSDEVQDLDILEQIEMYAIATQVDAA